MKIYKFEELWTKTENRLYAVSEIEVEEKPKTYKGRHTVINKNEIDLLQYSLRYYMYRLTNNPALFIETVIERKKGNIERGEKIIADYKAELQNWEALKERKNNDKQQESR